MRTAFSRGQLRLVTEAEGLSTSATERHACYPLRANRDEAAARLRLHPVRERDRLDNVSYIHRDPPEPPRAA